MTGEKTDGSASTQIARYLSPRSKLDCSCNPSGGARSSLNLASQMIPGKFAAHKPAAGLCESARKIRGHERTSVCGVCMDVYVCVRSCDGEIHTRSIQRLCCGPPFRHGSTAAPSVRSLKWLEQLLTDGRTVGRRSYLRESFGVK